MNKICLILLFLIAPLLIQAQYLPNKLDLSISVINGKYSKGSYIYHPISFYTGNGGIKGASISGVTRRNKVFSYGVELQFLNSSGAKYDPPGGGFVLDGKPIEGYYIWLDYNGISFADPQFRQYVFSPVLQFEYQPVADNFLRFVSLFVNLKPTFGISETFYRMKIPDDDATTSTYSIGIYKDFNPFIGIAGGPGISISINYRYKIYYSWMHHFNYSSEGLYETRYFSQSQSQFGVILNLGFDRRYYY